MTHITTTNLPDLARYFIGRGDPFSRFASIAQSASNYPPYNIVRLSDDEFELTVAVAGFSREEVTVTRERDVLTIKGSKKPDEEDRSFIHRGIALRDFERQFVLGEHVVVRRAKLSDGLLVIDLVREVPEASKALSIPLD